jgi:4-hydroxy-2-oxoheptanedioate aldolase
MSGVDFVIIDMEHSPKDWQLMGNMIRAVKLAGVAALVRVATAIPQNILHALELGADGIVLPFVESAEDVRAAVAAARYAPMGERGTCTISRAANYGIGREDFRATAESANRNIVLIGQIESARGVANIPEIVEEAPGLDSVIIGRADLASSIGYVGQTAHPEVIALAEQASATLARNSTKPFGLAVYGAAEASAWAEKGASVFVLSTDVSMLVGGFQDAVTDFHAAGASTNDD